MTTWLLHYSRGDEVGAGNEYVVLVDVRKVVSKRVLDENEKPGFMFRGAHEVLVDHQVGGLPMGSTMMAED